MRHALCQVLKHGDEPSVCESSCPCYYSQIEGLGLHVGYITLYVIRIKKHLRNRIEIIEIESNRKEYESLHPWSKCWSLSTKTLTWMIIFHLLLNNEIEAPFDFLISMFLNLLFF